MRATYLYTITKNNSLHMFCTYSIKLLNVHLTVFIIKMANIEKTCSLTI